MVGVIVLMALMAIALTVAVQTATFHKRRENEMELIFRGEQFVEGVRLFRGRNGRLPLTLDELVKANPRAMRKKWIDPVTGKFDWVPVFAGQGGQQVAGGAGGAQPLATPVPTAAPTPRPDDEDEGGGGGSDRRRGRGNQGEAAFAATDARGPIVGVHSRSRDEAIRVRDGRSRYSDWNFTLEQNQQGQRGTQGQQPQPTPRR
jgi:type II secretory pathway pseudopilin PulG